MLTGNKGEWSEIYTLFKLLGDKKLFSGDADLNKVEQLFYPIIKIIRNESAGNFEYEINGDIVIISGETEELRIPIKTFEDQSKKLLAKIKGLTGTFSIPEVEAFMTSVKCKTLKAKSTSKTDIRIVIHDQRINQTAELGFSIKSQLGKPSTLFNSSQGSNFIFKITNNFFSDTEIEKINNLKTKSKIQDRVKAILNTGAKLKFIKTEGSIFNNNLELIDSLLPQILAEILINFNSSTKNKLVDLAKNIEQENPLNFDLSNKHSYYNYKIKRLLTDVALGMLPTKVWMGKLDATGGYLVVKENGDILCYHIYNRNDFEEYLLTNTKIINPSSTRLKFGEIYKEKEELFIKLNLQIRFIK